MTFWQLTNLCDMHVDAAHELLDRLERELGLANSRGGGAIRDKETEKDAREEEFQRMKRVLARIALRRWSHKSLGQAWAKWREELRKSRFLGKIVIRWANRLTSRAWVAWEWMRMNKKRLLAIAAKCIGRWQHRTQALAWEQWCEQCENRKRLRKRATKAAKLWKNNIMGKGCALMGTKGQDGQALAKACW